MTLKLGQKPLDGCGQKPSAAEGSHVAEDVGGIKPLTGNVDFHVLSECVENVRENFYGQIVVAEILLISFE